MAALAAMTGMTLAPGLPVALLLGSRRSRAPTTIPPSALLYDAVALGLVVHLVAGLVLMRIGLFGPAGILGTAAGLTVAASVPLALRREHLPRVRMPSGTPMALAGVVLLAVAVLLRRNPVEFVFMIGDMGEYVNNAHRVVEGAELTETFPHLFVIFLAIPAALFEWTNTVDVLPLAGLLVLGGVLRLGGLLDVHPVPRSALGLVTAIGVVPVWFSLLPVSEALYAPLLLLVFVLLLRAHQEDASASAVLAGAMTLPLGLTRGNALLFLPLLLLYLLVSMVLPLRRDLDLRFVLAGLGGVFVSFAYNAGFLPVYYIGRQLMRFAPDGPVLAALDAGLLEPGWLLALAVAVVLVSVFGVERLARARMERLALRTRGTLASGAPVAILVAAAGAVLLLGPGGVFGGLSRLGVVFAVSGGLGLAVGTASAGVPGKRRLVMLGALVAAVFGVLHAIRVPVDVPHSYFLYLDRYLFSEVFVAFVIGGLVGLQTLWRQLSSRASERVLAVAAVLLLAAPLPMLRETLHATERRLFGDAYTYLGRLDELTSSDDVPIVFHGVDTPPDAWVYPNTYRALARPLQTIGHEFLNLPPGGQPFSPDPSPTYRDVRELMELHGLDRVYLMRVVDPDAPELEPPPVGLRVERSGTLGHTFGILNQDPGGAEVWHTVTFEVEVLEVRRVLAGGSTGAG